MDTEPNATDSNDLMWTVLESLIHLMEAARLDGDAKMLNSFARLVHETWHELFPNDDDELTEE